MTLRSPLALVAGLTRELASSDTLKVGAPFLFADMGNGSGSAVNQTIANAFTTVNLTSTMVSGGSWSSANHWWSVPYAGLYLFVGKVRVSDGVSGLISYGVGIGTSNADSPTFTWHETANNGSYYGRRNSATNVVALNLSAGDNVRLFAYMDNGGSTVDVAGGSLFGFMVT